MKPIRVALSGSGFKFPAHVGALLALRDAGCTPMEIAGTSGGSIIAALYASGMDLDEMADLTLNRDWSDMLTFSPWSLITKMGYCSGSNLLDWITAKTGGKTFAQLDMDLTIMASDVSAETPFEFSRGTTPDVPVALAARASASIPFVYAPVQYAGALLMDGGCCNNIPVDKLTVDLMPRFGVQLVSKVAPLSAGLHSIIGRAPRVIELMLSSNEETHVEMAKSAGASFAFVETGYASGLDRNMPQDLRKRLMDDGRQAVAELNK